MVNKTFTLSEFVNRAINGKSDMEYQSSRKSPSVDWCNTSYDDAAKMALTGDTARAQSINPAMTEILGGGIMFDVESRNDGGPIIDVAKFVSGEPECFMEFVPRNAIAGRKIKVAIRIGWNWKVDETAIDAKLRNVLAEVIGMQSAGHCVIVSAIINHAGNEDDRETTEIQINPSGELVDASIFAMVFSNYFFRRIVFSYWENRDSKFRKAFRIGNGYGHMASSHIEGYDKIYQFN